MMFGLIFLFLCLFPAERFFARRVSSVSINNMGEYIRRLGHYTIFVYGALFLCILYIIICYIFREYFWWPLTSV